MSFATTATTSFIGRRTDMGGHRPIFIFMLGENERPVPPCIETVNALRNAPDGVFEEWKQSLTALFFLKLMDFRTKSGAEDIGSK